MIKIYLYDGSNKEKIKRLAQGKVVSLKTLAGVHNVFNSQIGTLTVDASIPLWDYPMHDAVSCDLLKNVEGVYYTGPWAIKRGDFSESICGLVATAKLGLLILYYQTIPKPNIVYVSGKGIDKKLWAFFAERNIDIEIIVSKENDRLVKTIEAVAGTDNVQIIM